MTKSTARRDSVTASRPLPRGIRNNNPLNIRIGNVWLGEVKDPTDPDFEQFVSMLYGLRAAFVLMRRYILHYHRVTVPAIISAWAPSSENSTTKYIDFVCSYAGVSPDSVIDFYDKPLMCKLVAAMAHFECGCDLNMLDVERAYDMT